MILLVFIMVWLFYFNDGLDLHRYIHRKLVCANSSTCMMTLIAQRIVQQLRSSIHYDMLLHKISSTADESLQFDDADDLVQVA